MAIIQGYDGTRHTPSREVASNVKPSVQTKQC